MTRSRADCALRRPRLARGALMNRTLYVPLLLATSLIAAPQAYATDEANGAAQMTPEQKAEMEAYTKAGTPGEPHRKLAATAGRYTVTMKTWQDPKAAPM